MKPSKYSILAALALTASAALAGCAEVTSGINSVTAALSTPAATQAAANIKSVTLSFTCTVANVSAVESQIASLVSTSQAAIKDSQTVCLASSALCDALGGTAALAACTASVSSGGSQ